MSENNLFVNKKIVCYKCKNDSQLLVEEKVDIDSGRIVEKNFICFPCSKVQHESML